jgi:hypothetical protein
MNQHPLTSPCPQDAAAAPNSKNRAGVTPHGS